MIKSSSMTIGLINIFIKKSSKRPARWKYASNAGMMHAEITIQKYQPTETRYVTLKITVLSFYTTPSTKELIRNVLSEEFCNSENIVLVVLEILCAYWIAKNFFLKRKEIIDTSHVWSGCESA